MPSGIYKRKPFTKEHRKKLSEAAKEYIPWNKGLKNCYSEKTLQKMSEGKAGEIPWNKGKIGLYQTSEETKVKLSKIGKGRKHTEKTKEKIGKGNKGKKLTEETKQKISESHIGKKHTEKTKEKIGKSNIGELNSNWKGGISCEPYCDVWLDKEYKESIKERDNYQCQNPFCLCDNIKLVVHHINYIKKDCKPDNLITVCNSSNSKANFDKWVWQEIYEKIINN